MRAVGLEYAGSGVVINAIATNFMDTPGFRASFGADEPGRRAELEALVPLGRLGTAEEVAELAAVPLEGGADSRRADFQHERRLERLSSDAPPLLRLYIPSPPMARSGLTRCGAYLSRGSRFPRRDPRMPRTPRRRERYGPMKGRPERTITAGWPGGTG